MLKIITAFNQILTPLCELQESAWNGEEPKWKPSKRALETYKFVSDQLLLSVRPIKPKEIEEFFSPSKTAKVNFFKENRVLYLPPLRKDADDAEFVPIFSLCCNLSKDQSIARFRVMLVTLDEDDKETLNGIGFRMETPEHRNSTGIHDFHHAQLIQQFNPKRSDDKLRTKCPSWLPESQPSFPMPADCPVTLLLCIILTLYGWEYYKKICYRICGIEQYRKKLEIFIGKRPIRG